MVELDILSPEQLDAVLDIKNAWHRGHGFANADDVGLGKGRQVAAAWVAADGGYGERIIVMTAGPSNYADQLDEFRDGVAASSAARGSAPWHPSAGTGSARRRGSCAPWSAPQQRDGGTGGAVMAAGADDARPPGRSGSRAGICGKRA